MANTTQVQETAATRVLKEVKNAYADCWMDGNEGEKFRKLNFTASAAVSQAEAHRILSEAIPNGYNNFNAKLILDFPSSSQFIIAREGSVCLYVTGKRLPRCEDLGADEYDKANGGLTRIWWD